MLHGSPTLAGITLWLGQNRIIHVAPELLASSLYADASHPLTEGYKSLAQTILNGDQFKAWMR